MYQILLLNFNDEVKKKQKTWCPIQTVSMFYSYNVSIYYCLPPDIHKLYNQKRGNFTPVQWRTNFNLLVYALCMSLLYTARLWYLSHFIYFIFRELSFMYHRFWKGTLLICVFIYNRMNWSEQVSEEAFNLKYNLLQLLLSFGFVWLVFAG